MVVKKKVREERKKEKKKKKKKEKRRKEKKERKKKRAANQCHPNLYQTTACFFRLISGSFGKNNIPQVKQLLFVIFIGDIITNL